MNITKKSFIICLIMLILSLPNYSFSQYDFSDDYGADGKKISIDVKGMDVVEVLKMLASKGSLNIVVGSNVRGKVTMFLKDVNVRDAFDLILVANQLAKDERSGIIYVMTERDYAQIYGKEYDDQKEAKIIKLRYANAVEVGKVLTQIKTKVGRIITDESSNTLVVIDAPSTVKQITSLVEKLDSPTHTKIFELNHAKAKDLQERIKEMLTKGVGSMQTDERTNKLVITDLEPNLVKIEKVITAFDSRLQQVLIEAKIIEITLDDEYKLGIDWDIVSNEFQKILGGKDVGIKMDFKLAPQGTFAPGGEVLIGAFGTGDYAAMVQALKKVGDSNILSSPRITALDNEESKILVGSSEPYATNTVTQGTSTTTTATSLTFLDLGVKLHVTPMINKNGLVTMKINPEVSSKSGEYTYGSPATTVPIVSTTQAETNVMVKDGHTIIIAGLIKDERSGVVHEVPFLGSLPIIGNLFKKTDNTVEKKELVIFITPHIISGDIDFIDNPLTAPIGKDIFTIPEHPTFYEREPVTADPEYLKRNNKNILDFKALKFKEYNEADYYNDIKGTILSNIRMSESPGLIAPGDKVKVSFTLYSGGNLIAEPIAVESSNDNFFKVVKSAIINSAPFPNFPDSSKDARKTFTIDLLYEPEVQGKKS